MEKQNRQKADESFWYQLRHLEILKPASLMGSRPPNFDCRLVENPGETTLPPSVLLSGPILL